jgi:hypothetical protein
MKTAVEFLDFKLNIERRMIKEDFQMVEICEIFDKAQEIEDERLKEAYSMGRLGKSIKEFNETFKQQEQ